MREVISQKKGEFIAASAFGILVAVLLFALRVDRMPGDSSGLVNLMATEGGPFVFWYHLGYAWLARLVQALLAAPLELNVRETLELLSALAAGASCTLAYVTLRRLSASILSAALSATLMASVVAFINHGTIIEVHTVQLATAWAGLCLMARAAELPLLRLFGTSLIAGLIVSTGHQTGPLLFPGLVLASIWTCGGPLSPPEQLKRFAISCAAFLCALGISRYLTSALSPFEDLKDLSDFTKGTAMLTKGVSWQFTVFELLIPLGALSILPLATLVRRLRGQSEVWLGLVLALVPWTFFLCFGESTEGGYFLGSSIGCVLLVSRLFERTELPGRDRFYRGIGVCAVIVSVCVSPFFLFSGQHGDQNQRAKERFETVVGLLPDGGTLVTLPYAEHTLNGQKTGIKEVILCGPFRQYIKIGYVADGAYLFLNERLKELAIQGQTLLVDWTWDYRIFHPEPSWQQDPTEFRTDRSAGAPLYLEESWQPYLDAVRSGLERDWNVIEVPSAWSLFLRIERR